LIILFIFRMGSTREISMMCIWMLTAFASAFLSLVSLVDVD
jgi:hypothetical protein